MCRLSPVASDIPVKTNKKEVEIVGHGWPECGEAAPRVSTCLLPISGRADPELSTRTRGCKCTLLVASQRYRTSIVSYAFDLGTPTHESEIGSIANDQLFVVTDSMKINKGCITKFQAWYMMHRCKNRCIEWELVTFLWSVEISTASLSVVCICILTDGAINKKHIYVAWRWWWGLAAAPAEAWKPNSIRAESGLPIVKQHPHLKHNYHF